MSAATDATLWWGIEVDAPAGLSAGPGLAAWIEQVTAVLGDDAAGFEVRDGATPPVVVASVASERSGAAPEQAQSWVDRVARALRDAGVSAGGVRAAPFEDIDWAEHWKRHFRPLRFGPLSIVPSWLAESDAEDASTIIVDPSSAFGTGLHETTQLCIEYLLSLDALGGAAVLDVGTGTGILAMAALKLGAARAVATDNDPEALRVAKENAERNALASALTLSDLPPDRLSERFPVVIANILAGPLCDMAPALAGRVAPGGRLALSGIMASQADDVIARYQAQGLVFEAVRSRGEWVLLPFVRPGA